MIASLAICLLWFFYQAELKKLSYEEGKEETLTAEKQRISQEVQRLNETVDTLEAK